MRLRAIRICAPLLVALTIGVDGRAAELAAVSAGEATYEGSLDVVGHYAKPGDTRRYGSIQRFLSNGRGTVRLEWTTWSEGDSSRVPESFLVQGARVFHRDDPSARWEEFAGMRADQARFQAMAGFTTGERAQQPESTVVVRAHPRLGDVRDRAIFTYSDSAGVNLTMAVHELHHEWTLRARRMSKLPLSAHDSLFMVPATFDPAPPNPDSLRGEAVLTRVAEGVWSVDMEDVDSRSMVVEFADHLAVIEVALSSANGERLVDAVKRAWPAKRIRYVLFSHHHPHYLGGLRALIAEGATVVTTPGNEAYVNRIAGYRFGLAPDRLARSPRPVHVLPFPARIELSDSTNRLVAINIGKRSDHTDEFTLFWLPRQRLLFEAEQGWVTVNGTLRASRRAPTLLQILTQEGLDVDRFVQSWPMRGDRAEVSMSELKELVAKKRK